MAHVTSALLEIELAQLKKQYQQLINDENAMFGAIQFCEHLLATISGTTIVPEAASPEAASLETPVS